MNFANLTSHEVEEIVKKNPIAILPVGSVEEHGMHLPLSTDMVQPSHVAYEASKRIKDCTLLLLPPLPYGNCVSTRNFPGTISVSFDSLRAFVLDILTELSRNGIKKVIILSGHAGSMHMAALRNAAELATAFDEDMKIMVLSDYDLAYNLLDEKIRNTSGIRFGVNIPKDDGHAGLIETSRMLNITPELVKKKEMRKGGKRLGNRFLITAHPERTIPTGVHGEPKNASAEIGKKIEEYIIEEFIKLIYELHKM